MNTSFLDYYKIILERVSFDRNLFGKEYRKAMSILTQDEAGELEVWIRARGYHHILPAPVT